jgi:hypothetical protein
MKNIIFYLIFCLYIPLNFSYAQTDSTIIEEEETEETTDFSKMVAGEKVKAFCSSRILGQVPQKLISIGYDLQTANTLTAGRFGENPENSQKISLNRGLRVGVNYPVISKNNILLNLGFNYTENLYHFENSVENAHPLIRSLEQNGLRSLGLNATVFKPLNLKNFLLFQVAANLNGDFTFSNFQSLEYLRYSAAAVYGWKPHDRLMWGLGVSRSYLAGALNYFPVLYYFYTSENGKWGLEGLLPGRFNYRRTLDKKNILLFGFELEGNTFRLNNQNNIFDTNLKELELRRSELRIRATYERAISRLIWASIQVGYRYNWDFNIDNGDFFRSIFDDKPFLINNRLTNPLYFSITLNWVSP